MSGLVLPDEPSQQRPAGDPAPRFPPWLRGAASGVGSMPGADPAEAARLVLGELPALPHLPELPERGPGADSVGRGAGLLAGLYVDLQPAGWRFVPRPGVDHRRTADLLERDLDAFAEAADGYAGPLKVQAAGPWTLAAGVELTRGDRALRDPGAVRDLAESLAEGLARHLAELRRRVPGLTALVVQLDEPDLPDVLAGTLPTASGFDRHRVPAEGVAEARLGQVLARIAAERGVPAVRCAVPQPPVGLLHAAGARVIGVDATLLTRYDDDPLGVALEAGLGLLAGCVSSSGDDSELSDARRTVSAVTSLWHRLGLPAERCGEVVVVTPTAGFAGAEPDRVLAVLAAARDGGRVLDEQPD